MANDNAKRPVLIPPASMAFLRLLGKNNNRDWFNANKDRFLAEQLLIENFAGALLAGLNNHDLIETPSGKKSLLRIYRDTRFSNNKTPYKTYWSGHFTRATKWRRGGYYFHFEAGNNFIAGGFRGPGAADLKRIRDDIAFDAATLRKIMAAKTVQSYFGTLQGEQVKTAPKGFESSNPAIDLLRYKQFLLIRRFTDKEILDPSFLKEAGQTFKAMRPFLDYMSEVLTTDINGMVV